MCILPLKIDLGKSQPHTISHSGFPPTCLEICEPRVLNACYLMSVCLRICGSVYSLFALCHSAEMDSLSQLARRALSLALSWRNKGMAIRRSLWREGSLLTQSLEGPHQHWRTVLTEPLNWVQESNSWDIKPGQICSSTNNRDPSAFGE